MNATKETYLSLEEAYFEFNKRLFGGSLPECLITLQREKKTLGYYHAQIFEGKNGNTGKRTDEIALNPNHFSRHDKEVLSTLVHEMCHLWHFHFAPKKGRNGYHTKEWADKMEEVGLMPSNTGLPGGKRTGQRMTHYIIEGGSFDKVCDLLLNTGSMIHWRSTRDDGTTNTPKKKKKSGSRVKYTCPECKTNIWGKEGIFVMCMTCEVPYVTNTTGL